MKVLVACEFSGVVRRAFRERGHDAWSCDLLPAEDGGPHHIQGDILVELRYWNGITSGHIERRWDLMIAFPPCTHIAVSGARYFTEKRADGRQQAAINFFMALANAPIPRIAIENPVGIMSTKWRKPDQVIQPWQFGHPESKTTCLWLKNLPPLTRTNVLPLPKTGRWLNQTPSGQNKLGPSPERAQNRGRTYEGIAKAMANQWGG